MEKNVEQVDAFLEELIRRERFVEPDPFLGTRLIQALENRLEELTSASHFMIRNLLQPVMVTVGLVFAALIGISLGLIQGRQSEAGVRNEQIQELRNSFYISDFADEGTYFMNKN
jgi:hypothetical protein